MFTKGYYNQEYWKWFILQTSICVILVKFSKYFSGKCHDEHFQSNRSTLINLIMVIRADIILSL